MTSVFSCILTCCIPTLYTANHKTHKDGGGDDCRNISSRRTVVFQRGLGEERERRGRGGGGGRGGDREEEEGQKEEVEDVKTKEEEQEEEGVGRGNLQ